MSNPFLAAGPQVPIPQPSKPQEPSDNGLGISDSKYQQIIKKSLVTTGNNHLVKQVLAKLKAGQEIIVAAIGGSVTEGAGPQDFHDGYAYQFKELFTQKYASSPDKVKFIPAGLGGTPSALGAIRFKKDVVQAAGTYPDLLLVEFAVNDWLECTNTRGIEYIVRDALAHNTAVIIVYAAATYTNQQAQISPVADFYSLPQVSMSNGLAGSGVNQEKDGKVYYSDYVHPTKPGHTYMALCLMNLIEQIDSATEDAPYILPQTWKNENAFVNFDTVFADTDFAAKGITINPGSFTKKDAEVQAYMHGGKSFGENWSISLGGPSTGSGTAESSGTAREAGTPFTMSLKCKTLVMVYKNASSDKFGTAEVYVDGKLQKAYAGHEEGGWNNCMVVMLLDEKNPALHTIEIKMAQDGNDKAFTILGFGYSY